MRYDKPLLGRFFAKLVFDVLPAALASLVGGFLLTHYGLGRAPVPAAQAAPATAEMMQLLRDEHGLIVNFLKAEMASEKKRLAATDGAPRGAVAAEPAASTAVPRQTVVAVAAAKPATSRTKTSTAGASLPPLVIAQAQPPQNDSVKPAANNSDSILAKTIGIKDNVVAVTYRMVSVIGGIPSWFGSIGDRIGGEGAQRPAVNLVSAS
jgi:hypothetical protein